jgi:exodeoxyribonuclease VII large subunit
VEKISNILTVSQISGQIKNLIETNFDQVVVVGEISNFKAHSSGHWYFTLKDENAQINCTMWKGVNSFVFFTPQDGLKIVVTGKISVYPPRGNYQIDVRSMKPAGEGELQAAFERLKRKLSDEGLFDVEHKMPVTKLPEKIGIVTAGDSAAFKDIVNIAERRFPLVELVLRSSKVQGEGAAGEIAAAINELNKTDVDTIIIARGGGSLEDLWAFNEEIVARAIFDSTIPIISGVGHEIDYTIADFVADLRAPTPSAAIELATPNTREIITYIIDFENESFKVLNYRISDASEEVDSILNSYSFRIPAGLIGTKSQQLDNIFFRFDTALKSVLKQYKNQVVLLSKILGNFDVKKTLQRGFALVKQNELLIKRSNDLNIDKNIIIKFFDGEVEIRNE